MPPLAMTDCGVVPKLFARLLPFSIAEIELLQGGQLAQCDGDAPFELVAAQ